MNVMSLQRPTPCPQRARARVQTGVLGRGDVTRVQVIHTTLAQKASSTKGHDFACIAGELNVYQRVISDTAVPTIK